MSRFLHSFLALVISGGLFVGVVAPTMAQAPPPIPPVAQPRVDEVGVDVVLVIDRSGSMADDGYDPDIGDYQPIGSAKIAASIFVTLMDFSQDQAGLVSFSSYARLDQPLTNNSALMLDAIDDLAAGGNTSIDDGIYAARDELLGANHKVDNAPVMIVLSDGLNGNGSGPVIAAAQAAKTAGIRIFTIGLGQGVDADVMRQAASADSDYYFAPTATELQEIYSKIARGVRPDPQGALRLSARDAYRADNDVIISLSVFNGSAATETFTVRVQLKHGFGIIQEFSENHLVAFGSTLDRRYNLGKLDPELRNYTVVVDLYDSGGGWLDGEFAAFVVGDELEALNAGDRLSDAARKEINDIQSLLVDDTTRGFELGSKSVAEAAVDLLLNKIGPFVTNMGLPISAEAIDNVVQAFIGEFLSTTLWNKVEQAGSHEQLDSLARGIVAPRLDPKRDTILDEQHSFRDSLANQTVAWDASWNRRVALAEELIRSRIEEARVAYFIDLDMHWSIWPPSLPDPELKQSTLAEADSVFDWFASEEAWGGQWFLEGLTWIAIALLIIIMLLVLLFPSGEEIPAAVAILAALKNAGAIISAVGLAKSASIFLITLLAMGIIHGSAVGPVSQTVLDGQIDGLDELRQLLGGLRQAGGIQPAEVTVAGREVTLAAGADQEVYLYNGYGGMIDRLTFGEGRAQTAELSPGRYAVVTAAGDLSAATRQDISISAAAVSLVLAVDDPIRPQDLAYNATLTISNDTATSTGPLTVASSLLDGEGIEMWSIDLGPYETRQLSHNFTVPAPGPYVLRAYVEDGTQALAEAALGLVVGQSPVFLATANPQDDYQPGEWIAIPLTVENQGNRSGHAAVAVELWDIVEPLSDGPLLADSFAFDLPPGGVEMPLFDVGQLLPGHYRLALYLNGVAFGSRDFIQAADGTLFAIPLLYGPTLDPGQQVIPYTVSLLDETLNPIAAPIEGRAVAPDGTEFNVTATSAGTGLYHFDIPAPIEGTYEIEILAADHTRRVIGLDDYAIRGAPSFIYPTIVGGLVDDRLRPLQFTLENEYGRPVSGARVTVSDSNGGQTALANEAGIATLTIETVGAVEVHVTKEGYAATTFTLPTLGATATQDLWLAAGWNLVSFTRTPSDMAASQVSAPIRLDLERIVGFDGGIELYYDPKLPPQNNSLTSLAPQDGYWVWTKRSVVWPVEGDPLAVNTPISLNAGWNLISYLPDETLPVETALASILDHVEMVRGFEGRGLTYAPGLPLSLQTLRAMRPGMGYWVKLSAGDTLIYPDPATLPPAAKAYEPNPTAETMAGAPVPSRYWADVYGLGLNWNNAPLATGSVITIHSSESGELYGRGVVVEAGQIELLPVYGDDPLTPADEGAEPGEELTVMVNGEYYPLQEPLLWQDGAMLNVIRAIDIKILYLPVVSNGGSGSSNQPLLNGNFEHGSGVGWGEYSSNGWTLVVDSFPGTVLPMSGQWAVWLGGDYNETSVLSQAVTVPGNQRFLTYFHWIASEDYCGYDFGGVLVNGQLYESFDLCTANEMPGWGMRSVDLAAFVGQHVMLEFVVTTDGSLNSNWFIDDVAFAASAVSAGTAAGESAPGAAEMKATRNP